MVVHKREPEITTEKKVHEGNQEHSQVLSIISIKDGHNHSHKANTRDNLSKQYVIDQKNDTKEVFDALSGINRVEQKEKTHNTNVHKNVIVLTLRMLGKKEQDVKACRIY